MPRTGEIEHIPCMRPMRRWGTSIKSVIRPAHTPGAGVNVDETVS